MTITPCFKRVHDDYAQSNKSLCVKRNVSFDFKAKQVDAEFNPFPIHEQVQTSSNLWHNYRMRQVFIGQIIDEYYDSNEVYGVPLFSRMQQKVIPEMIALWESTLHSYLADLASHDKEGIKTHSEILLNIYANTISLEFRSYPWDDGFVPPEREKIKQKKVRFHVFGNDDVVTIRDIERFPDSIRINNNKVSKLLLEIRKYENLEDPSSIKRCVSKIIAEYLYGNKSGLMRRVPLYDRVHKILSEGELTEWENIIQAFRNEEKIKPYQARLFELYQKTILSIDEHSQIYRALERDNNGIKVKRLRNMDVFFGAFTQKPFGLKPEEIECAKELIDKYYNQNILDSVVLDELLRRLK